MTNSFDSKSLAEKLNKLNNSQQSIGSLSSWCIAHRNKAKQITETWEKVFNSPSKDSNELKVSLLYLANDILQNSRREGCEFVNEFWKVLPRALKNLYIKGEDNEKSVILRLVGIWDERKVFGSRGRGLKNGIIYNENQPPSSLEINGKISNSNPMKVVQKDTQTIRIKLAVGGMPEKIITAFQSVLDEHLDEDTALNTCENAIHLVGKIAEDIDGASAQGSMQESALTNELHAQETILKQCIDQFRSYEANRVSLVTYMREGLQEQESKLELIRTQLLAARKETERINDLKHKISSSPNPNPNPNSETTAATKAPQPVTYFSVPSTTSTKDEQSTKAAAAAMAAKLAASSSSAQMLSSLLSSLVAEEAASKSSPISPEKRQKLDNFHMPHQQLVGSAPLSPFPPPMSQYLQTPSVAPFIFPGNSMQSPSQQPLLPHQQPLHPHQQPLLPHQQHPVLPPQQQALGTGYYLGNGFYGGQPQQLQSSRQ